MIFIVIKVPFLKPLIQVMHFLDTKKHKEGERFVLYNILYYIILTVYILRYK